MLIREKYLLNVIIAPILISVITLSSCSRLQPDSDLGEYKVPATYTAYTDKNGLFSISYPSDWELPSASQFSHFEDESDSLNEYLKGNKFTIDTNIPNAPNIKNSWLLLFAAKGEDAMLIVSATSIADTRSLKGKTKEQIYNAVLETKDHKPFLQEILKLGGNEVAIFKVPPNLEISNIVSVTITDSIVWGAACNVSKNVTLDDIKDFQIIVRSLRVLK